MLNDIGMPSNNTPGWKWAKSIPDSAAFPMISDRLVFSYDNQNLLHGEQPNQKRRPWSLLQRTFSRCWSPEFSSRVLESQYWRCAFPQIRLRFRAGLVYILIYILVWLIYFVILYPVNEIAQFVVFSSVVMLVLLSVFVFTWSNLYRRLYVHTSVFCICTVAISCLFLFMVDKPALTVLASFALSIEVILLIYTVIPLPMYLCVLLAMAFSVLFEELRYSVNQHRYRGTMFFFYALAHMLGVHIFVLMQVRDRKTFLKVGQSLLARKDLEIEKEFKDRMIESVMPRTIAEELLKESNELKRPSSTPSDRVNVFRPFNMNLMHNVSILFADIVGFTNMSSNKSADELVNMLNDLFGRFDILCGKCGCEKISTLGDCYYCVAGCPEPKPDHAKCCVEMGLAMIEAIHEFDRDRKQQVNMRVGIHTGTVLCGIVGRQRFKFDVFSNDVDLANMMESTGQSGRVHISEATAKFLGDEYLLEECPLPPEKRRNQNNLRTFFILGRSQAWRKISDATATSFNLAFDFMRTEELHHADSSDIVTSVRDIPRQIDTYHQPFSKTQSASNLDVPPQHPESAALTTVSESAVNGEKGESASLAGVCNSDDQSLGTVEKPDMRSVTFKAGECEYYSTFDEKKSADRDLGQLSNRDAESSIDHVLSTHTASISRFEATHVDFDVRLAEAIRGSSLADGDYMTRRKALNPLTLKFTDGNVERQYRNHFSYEPSDSDQTVISAVTGRRHRHERTRDEWHVDAPKLSVMFDALIAITMVLVLSALTLSAFGVPNAGYTAYMSICLLFIVAFLSLSVYYFIRRGTLPPMLVKWWPKHIISLLLINIPVGIILMNMHCPAKRFGLIESAKFGEDYLIFICLMVLMVMFGHVNFSQIRSLPKSISCLIIGVGLTVMVNVCLLSCDNRSLFMVSMQLRDVPPGVSNWKLLNETAGADIQLSNLSVVYNISTQVSGSYSESMACFQTEVYIVVFLVCLLIVFLNYQFEASFRMSFYGDMQACETIRKMKEMKDQADWLLSNIIPHHVIEHLARTSKYSENHDMVAVLFASIVNWNEMYEETYEGGKEFLRVLNELISDFDELLDRPEFTQVEKIKTIGPTYMAASGLNPERRRLSMHPYSHLYELMEFALALQETLDNFNKDLLSFEFVMKIGYNIGPVTAGVIGTTKLYYDIWGDTVNISSRMYSTGVVGRIQVSRQAKEHLENVYDFEFREHIMVKGVDGGMDVYFLVGRKQNMAPRVQHKLLTCDGS